MPVGMLLQIDVHHENGCVPVCLYFKTSLRVHSLPCNNCVQYSMYTPASHILHSALEVICVLGDLQAQRPGPRIR